MMRMIVMIMGIDRKYLAMMEKLYFGIFEFQILVVKF